MEKVIDQAWETLLASVLKKRDVLRPGIGDEIDLYVPQSRLLSLVEADSSIPRKLYSSARESARRNAVSIVGKLGMPADYFWKFEYWPKTRAYTTLEKIVSRVFSSIMKQAKEGELKIVDLDIDPLKIDISFSDCVECAGVSGFDSGICFYHAGTLSGILAGLINRDLDGYETACHASGSESCSFSVGDRSETEINEAFGRFIDPSGISPDLALRAEQSLNRTQVRAVGNMVDINYLQLAVANILSSDPEAFSSNSYDIGTRLGRKLAPVLAGFYGKDDLETLKDFYLQLGEFGIEINGGDSRYDMVISECAESSGKDKLIEMTSFLSGELRGLISEMTHAEMQLENSRFEGDRLLLSYVPEG